MFGRDGGALPMRGGGVESRASGRMEGPPVSASTRLTSAAMSTGLMKNALPSFEIASSMLLIGPTPVPK